MSSGSYQTFLNFCRIFFQLLFRFFLSLKKKTLALIHNYIVYVVSFFFKLTLVIMRFQLVKKYKTANILVINESSFYSFLQLKC